MFGITKGPIEPFFSDDHSVRSDDLIFDFEEESVVESNEVKRAETQVETTFLEKRLTIQILQEQVPANIFVISAEKVKKLLILTGLNINNLMRELVPHAKERARPPISQYKVGAVGLGGSGAIYLGVNLEFKGFQLNQTVHGEQFLAALARESGETTLTKIALSAEPCGHCRQFLNELDEDSNLEILTPHNEPIALSSLLPKNFGPKNLGIKGGLLAEQKPFRAEHQDYLIACGIEAAMRSYAPFTESPSGVAIETEDKKCFSGSYCENAAYNPTLPPLQAALISLVAAGGDYAEIKRVVLVEKREAMTQHALITEAIIKSIAPKATFLLEHI